jgi:putative ABC transport system substrate-binding protein
MRRRDFIAGLVAAGTIAGRGRAEETTKPARIGVVYAGIRTNDTIEGFHRGLADKGYVEGQNLVIEERFAEGRSDRLPALIAEVLAHQIDVLYAPGTETALAAKGQTTTVPIVFISSDPMRAGLVPSLARPSRNLTGLSLLSGEYSRKWLELLKEAVPNLRRVGALWIPENPVIVAEVEGMRQAAPRLGIDVASFSAVPKELEASLAAITSRGAEALILTDDAIVQALAPRLSAFAAEHHLPALAGFSAGVREGLLMSYSVDFVALGRRAADYVDRILKGARPADLPVEQASQFALRINLKTAKALGITIPFSLLAGADEVIE